MTAVNSTPAPSLERDPPLLVSPEWLAERLDAPDLVILDCSTRIEPRDGAPAANIPERDVFEAAHIPGARFADMVADLSDPEGPYPFTAPTGPALALALAALGIGEGTRVVCYAAGNPWWATRAWWLMRLYGFDACGVLDGGLKAWKAAGLPVETGPAAPAPAATPFAPSAPRPLLATLAEVEAASASGACLLNALPAASFATARIPGSTSLPGIETLDPATGRYLPDAVLRPRFAEAIPLDGPVIAYCGGGVTATLAAFHMLRLGLPEPRVYDHSMQEWTADPAREVARG